MKLIIRIAPGPLLVQLAGILACAGLISVAAYAAMEGWL